MNEIFLAVDLGQSLTKVVYRTDSNSKTNYVLINSNIAFTTVAKLQKYQELQGWIGKPRPEMQGWLKLDGFENNSQVCVLGELAEKFTTEEQIEESKSSYAGYKVLAAIGVIVQNHNLNTSKKIRINVGILLPVNEYQDRQRLKSYLQEIKSYSFRDEILKVNWQNTMILPEGGGLVCAKAQSSDLSDNDKYGVLVMGHRNLTALYFEKGQMIESASPLLGFRYVLKCVSQFTSILNEDRLLKAICDASLGNLSTEKENQNGSSYPDWSKTNAIAQLSTAKDLKLKQKEIEALSKAINAALEIGAENIEKKLLSKVFPPKMDKVIVSGGSSMIFQPFLEKYFNCIVSKNSFNSSHQYEPITYKKHFTPIIWEAGQTKKIREILELSKSVDDLVLVRRLADSFCLMSHMITIYKCQTKQ